MTDEVKQQSNYERLAAVNVNAQIEKKGGLSYLSWAWALDHLLRLDPDASWDYADIQYFPDRTAMVRCTVVAFGKGRTMSLPIMDHRNKPIAEPDAFQVNTAMQRCLVKAIALHGLGLYIYAGEDLPPGEPVDKETGEVAPAKTNKDSARQVTVDAFEALPDDTKDLIRSHASHVKALHASRGDVAGYLSQQSFDQEAKLALWSQLPSNVRSWIKDQEQIARMNSAARTMKSTELASQA